MWTLLSLYSMETKKQATMINYKLNKIHKNKCIQQTEIDRHINCISLRKVEYNIYFKIYIKPTMTNHIQDISFKYLELHKMTE